MTSLRVLIVDDEPLARRGIAARLGAVPGIAAIEECGGGRDAIRMIRELDPDLVFLDIQMPGVGGFDVVDAIGANEMPTTIFVTAFDQYALRAFEAEALDYLLKPIDDDRFARTLERAKVRIEERRQHRSRASKARLLVRERGRVELVDIDQIAWIEARGDYVRLHCDDRNVLLRETMTSLSRRLDPERFARIHRSTIVNLTRVKTVGFHAEREWSVTLRDGTIHKVGRRYRAILEGLTAREPR